MLDNRPTLEEVMRQDAEAYLEAVTRAANARMRKNDIDTEIRNAEADIDACKLKLAERVGRNIPNRYIKVGNSVVHVQCTDHGGKYDACAVTVGELL